jgi:hypothetical protein
MARVLRQGPAVVGCEGRTCAERSARLLATSPFAFQLPSSGFRGENEDVGGASRGMHYNTSNHRDLTKEQPSVRASSSTGEQTSNEIRASNAMRRPTNRQEVMQLTREAGGGLTWAEQFMLKRKRLQDSK